ncbi:type II toxin-antitoxin system SpoIISA family toxin [Paraliobacillus ryukyuensis]|uniref:type II toxin-antitoxin system SpoIISA family toxin n=1 Tax=Paraliobacillus ryukyuensis TaxID=200904 RepID=UPI0024822BFA|nr:type II toxin-antitoxin system SpoIISA family toxin [Paraliobacillus ryukyuensis]
MLALVAIVIFIDIFVFSTPTITKIWKTEFQAYDPLKTYIQENSFIEEKQRDKLNYFSQLIQIAPYIKSEIELQHNDFLEGLGAFLNYYAEGFGLCIHLYNVETVADQSEDERMNEFLDTIHRIKQTHTLDWLCMLDNLDVQGDSDAEEVVIDNLWSGEIVALDREEKHGKGMSHLCPIFVGDDYIFILFIEEIYQRIYEIDALFITNLAFLYCYLETQN